MKVPNLHWRFPILRHQTYIDDCAFGADDQILARQTRDELIELLKEGDFIDFCLENR